jgi:hypothetical protein
MEKISAAGESTSANVQADELIASIDKSLDNFTAEAIKAGREYSNYTMNQCIAVSMSGVSLLNELKTVILFALFAYAAMILLSVSKKFPKS